VPRRARRALLNRAATLAVVFDLDGVLLDSEPVWERVRRELVTESGGTYPDGATRAIMGMSAPEWSHYIRTKLGVDLPEPEINARVVAGVIAAYDQKLPLIRGAVDAVRRIAACVPVGIASSSNRVLIDLAVARAGLTDVMRAVVSAEEAGRGKPAPDVYLRAAELLGVPASACGAVEDSSNGIRSAHAAGMLTVAIPNREYPPEQAALDLADVVLHDIVALEPATFGLH
jgi:HAD superfamily hydrolase (TIGR01509 family)